MKTSPRSVYTALFLVLGCVIFRLLSSLFPEALPNISPLMAVAFVGAMYLPHRWGWLVGPLCMIITDLAFLRLNYVTDGTMFSWWTFFSLAIYALAGGLGILISRRPNLVRIAAGSIACSLLFYVTANTFSWWHNLAPHVDGLPVYASTFAGWWQANTVGLPGYVPTWTFLRNGVAGDLFFASVLLLALDPGLLLGRAPVQAAARHA